MCGKGPSLQGFGGQKRVGVIPNSRFLTGVGRSTRDHSVLLWDDGASWAIGQGPCSYCAGWQAGRLIIAGTVHFPSEWLE